MTPTDVSIDQLLQGFNLQNCEPEVFRQVNEVVGKQYASFLNGSDQALDHVERALLINIAMKAGSG